jgi:hypothetical protein
MHRTILKTFAAVVLLPVALAVPSPEACAQYQNSIALAGGVYSASGFGTNPFIGARYNYFLPGGRMFIEAGIGVSSLKSHVLNTISNSQVFPSEDLYTYEFAIAYDPSPSGYFPYILGGVAGINQGGPTSFAAVLGLGKRMPFGSFFGSSRFGWRYDVRDQMFAQHINNAEPFLSHNIQFTLGVQYYF